VDVYFKCARVTVKFALFGRHLRFSDTLLFSPLNTVSNSIDGKMKNEVLFILAIPFDPKQESGRRLRRIIAICERLEVPSS